MRINELKARLAATLNGTTSPLPLNQDFVSLGELLLRVQRTPDTTMQQAADCLLSWGLLMGGAPKIMVNSKTRGVIPADRRSEKLAIGRLEYVFHRGHFESDGGEGASIDYDLFGFDRNEFSDFLITKVGESLDLFCPILDHTPASDLTSPTPSLATLVQGLPVESIAVEADAYKTQNNWDYHGLQRLLNESLQPGATHQTLAEKYGVTRQRIGSLINRAKPKKASPWDVAGSRIQKK